MSLKNLVSALGHLGTIESIAKDPKSEKYKIYFAPPYRHEKYRPLSWDALDKEHEEARLRGELPMGQIEFLKIYVNASESIVSNSNWISIETAANYNFLLILIRLIPGKYLRCIQNIFTIWRNCKCKTARCIFQSILHHSKST